jgi:putative ABC transport system permease protein
MGGVDPSLGQRIAALPEVSGSTAIRMGMASVDGKVVSLVAADPATAFDIVDVQPLRGSTAALEAPDVIAVHEDVAKDKGLDIGDTITMLFKDSGVQQLRVGLVYGEDRPGGQYILGMAAYEANFANRLDNAIYVKKAPDASIGAAQHALEAVATDYPGTEVLDQQAVKDAQAQAVNQVLALVYALLALAIVIALLGIGNTLALSIFERTRELGLLRAVGMTRSQLRAAVRWESVIIALQGTALGVAIGVFFGWALVLALRDQEIDQFRVPFQQLAMVVVLAGLAGVIAAILPARRASHLNVLQAITHD